MLTSQMHPSKSHLDLILKFYRGRSFGFHGGIDSVVRLVPRLICLFPPNGAEPPFERKGIVMAPETTPRLSAPIELLPKLYAN
jgi:hypothetical protein